MNGIVELRAIAKKSTNFDDMVKLSQDLYMLKSTGEVLEYNHSDTRADNKAGLARTFRDLRHLINENFTGALNELMFTLTYAENMTDLKKLYRDAQIFKQRLQRRYLDAELLTVVEPQERGAWHLHILARFDQCKTIFIPNDEIYKLWGHGWTTTRRIEKVDNIGAYLTAYLADIPLDADITLKEVKDLLRAGVEVVEKEVIGDDGQKLKKQIIKGGRLNLYPPGMNIYRKTRGIRVPEKKSMEYAQAKEIVGPRTPDYSTAREIYDDDGHFLNAVYYEQYNLRREKKQAQNEEAAQNDPASGNGGIPDRATSEGQQPQDPALLQADAEILPNLCQRNNDGRDNPPPVQTVLPAPCDEECDLDYDADIYSGPPCFPDMEFPGGLYDREYPDPLQMP